MAKTREKMEKQKQEKGKGRFLLSLGFIFLIGIVSAVTYDSTNSLFNDFDFGSSNTSISYDGISFNYGNSNQEIGYIKPSTNSLYNTNLLFGVYSGSEMTDILNLDGVNKLAIINGSINFTGKLNDILSITSGNVGIGTTSPSYKLTVGNGSNTDYSLMSAYFEGNISSAGYITRTSIYDKSQGSALDKIKDADEYKTNGKINHSAFFGYTSWMTNETDLSKPVIENQIKEVCDEPKCEEVCEDVLNEETQELENKCENKCDEPKCNNITEEVTTYPFTKEVKNEGVSLDSEIDLLRQSVYELKLQNENLKSRLDKIETETCTIKLFSWCLR